MRQENILNNPMQQQRTAGIVTKAYTFARNKHKGQTYGDGDFIDHPCQVVKILASINADMNLLASGYLHDVLEDTDTTYDDLLTNFNVDIANLVREVTKTKYNTFPDLHSRRGVMLKFADRLSNLKNMQLWDDEKQLKYIRKSKFWLNK